LGLGLERGEEMRMCIIRVWGVVMQISDQKTIKKEVKKC